MTERSKHALSVESKSLRVLAYSYEVTTIVTRIIKTSPRSTVSYLIDTESRAVRCATGVPLSMSFRVLG